jgi:uncharacterized protein
MTEPRELTPTRSTERVELLDAVRGLALFGIVTANMILYSLYLDLPEAAKKAMATHASDRVLDFLELFLIEGKFYTIFSVLFGTGFSVLLSRTRAKGRAFHRFYLRRVAILYLIGLAHAVLFFPDDILEAYAICGALLLPIVAARDRTVLVLAASALLAPMAVKLAGGMPVGMLTEAQDALHSRFGFTRDTVIDTWTRGSVGDIVRLNLSQVFSQWSFLLKSGMIFRIYGCFLLGLLIGRHELYRKLEAGRPILKRLATFGLALGLPLNFVYAASFDSGSWLEMLSGTFGVLPLSCGYVACWCLMWLDTKGRERLRRFAPVGRMALTNYVGQSVICTWIFQGTGLGLGGTMGPTLYLPIAFALYGVQVLLGQRWLERFRFGPLEWVWRMLTYGEWLPLAKRPAA